MIYLYIYMLYFQTLEKSLKHDIIGLPHEAQ